MATGDGAEDRSLMEAVAEELYLPDLMYGEGNLSCGEDACEEKAGVLKPLRLRPDAPSEGPWLESLRGLLRVFRVARLNSLWVTKRSYSERSFDNKLYTVNLPIHERIANGYILFQRFYDTRSLSNYTT